MNLNKLLTIGPKKGASDVYAKICTSLMMRLSGSLVFIGDTVSLAHEETSQMAPLVLP